MHMNMNEQKITRAHLALLSRLCWTDERLFVQGAQEQW